jgi:hypothetical protein
MNDQNKDEILREILKWQKLQGREILRTKLKNENILTSEKEIHIYYHSDGDKSSRDIEKLLNVSRGTVQNLWKQWIKAGIAEPTDKYGGRQCKRLFDLHDLGLVIAKTENKGEESDK